MATAVFHLIRPHRPGPDYQVASAGKHIPVDGQPAHRKSVGGQMVFKSNEGNSRNRPTRRSTRAADHACSVFGDFFLPLT